MRRWRDGDPQRRIPSPCRPDEPHRDTDSGEDRAGVTGMDRKRWRGPPCLRRSDGTGSGSMGQRAVPAREELPAGGDGEGSNDIEKNFRSGEYIFIYKGSRYDLCPAKWEHGLGHLSDRRGRILGARRPPADSAVSGGLPRGSAQRGAHRRSGHPAPSPQEGRRPKGVEWHDGYCNREAPLWGLPDGFCAAPARTVIRSVPAFADARYDPP